MVDKGLAASKKKAAISPKLRACNQVAILFESSAVFVITRSIAHPRPADHIYSFDGLMPKSFEITEGGYLVEKFRLGVA